MKRHCHWNPVTSTTTSARSSRPEVSASVFTLKAKSAPATARGMAVYTTSRRKFPFVCTGRSVRPRAR